MNQATMVRINELRSLQNTRPLTIEEMQEVVRLIRQDRRSAGEVSAASKAKKAKAPIDVQGILDAFN